MRRKFNVMLIALEQVKNYTSVCFFETINAACEFGMGLKRYNKNFAILGIFKTQQKSNHSWRVLIYDKELKIKHTIFVKSKKECNIIARIFLKYKDEYNITFKKLY